MLKLSSPTRVCPCGLLFVCVLGASASYLAWAAQPPRAADVADQSTAQVVDAQIAVTVGDAAPKSLRLVNPLDQPFAAKGDGADPWQAQFVASAVAGGKIKLAMVLSQGGTAIDKPVIVVEPNKAASVTVDGRDGRPQFRIDATLALHEAGWQPPMVAAATSSGASSTQPQYGRLSAPRYPVAALKRNIEGVVFVVAQIGVDGRVESARVDHVDPASAAVLGEAAIAAVRQWTFDPAKRDGVAVAGSALVPIRYSINRSGRTTPPKSPFSTPAGALDTIDVVGTQLPIRRG